MVSSSRQHEVQRDFAELIRVPDEAALLDRGALDGPQSETPAEELGELRRDVEFVEERLEAAFRTAVDCDSPANAPTQRQVSTAPATIDVAARETAAVTSW